MRFVSAVVAALVFVIPAPSPAQQTDDLVSSTPIRGVVELFTSQGCSSCPPADALFKRYAERSDVIAISLPVDYWDYLGWKDTLASAKNTQRQRAYASTRGDGAIYTPQIVVNGRHHVVGSRPRDVERALATGEADFRAHQVPVRIWYDSGALMIQAGEAPAGLAVEETTIWLAIVQKNAQVAVRGGENRGRALTYYNVARELAPIGTWHGKPVSIRLARTAVMMPESETWAVLLQQGSGGPIVGAAWMGL